MEVSKYSIQMQVNNVVINILDKYKLKSSPSIAIKNIIVDCSNYNDTNFLPTTITLLGRTTYNNKTYVTSLHLDKFTMSELGELLSDLTLIYKPKKVSIDENGIGRGVKEYLVGNLKQKGVEISKKDKVIYS